ncbi:DUF5979 domain-containing protein [Promicromonospora iranensis]|uniref:DUF5979 domain-containing protein n=1 Tax=Promicromonospora iranensis TaxID=1105144 RepID=UPI0023A97C59|nr:DUF5979 domain-containing protein [Promicromonospora iranensis]
MAERVVGGAARLRRGLAALGATAVLLPLALITAPPASAVQWGISKEEVSSGPYGPGDEVQFVITISCSDPNAVPCANAVLTDELPDGLELVSASIQSGPDGGQIDVDTETDTVTATWPSVPNGGQGQVFVTAQVDPDLPYSQDGVPITNTAMVSADNAPAETSDATVTPVVPLVLASETAKSIAPESAIAGPGTAATMTLSATNASNDAVDELVVQDPADPTADPSPFTYLEYTGTGDVTLPPNADTVTQEYWDGTQWLPLDDSVDPATVQGVRYTFSGDIRPGATATIPVEVQQRESVTELTEATTVTNDVSSYVVHGADESEPVTAEDTYVITPPDNSVTASKSFDPATVSAGAPTTVTLGATSTGDPTTSLAITEPSPGTPSPFEGDDPLTFTGFGPSGDGTGIQWPADADSATVTFTCADGTTPSLGTTTVGTLPNPPAGCTVVGFTVEFTGAIVTGGSASVPFTADTDPDQTTDDVTHGNEITATIPNAEGTASADLVTLDDRLATRTDKIIAPSIVPAVPGQSVVVELPTQLLPFGPDGSTTSANQVVIQDPTDPADPGEFWENFDATSVRTTDVPAGATLTVNYWDGAAWVPVPGCGPFTGPDTVSCDLPEDADGVQFVYDSEEGFPPGTSFQPNVTAAYDGPVDRDDPIANCAASTASSGTVEPTVPAEGCDTVDPFPVDGTGDLDIVEKSFLGGDPPTVLARSEDQVTAQITWSTDDFDGVDPMVLTDIADPAGTDVADSFYDAFDLVRVEPVSDSVDPLIRYDQVESVELFVDGAWVEAAGDPCPEACDGTFPGYTLSAEERASATSVRLTYVESPSRTAGGDPAMPQPGDGVARSTLGDGRHLQLTFQVRDDRRSDGEPVLGSTNGTVYNTADPGLVNNTVEAAATFEDETFTDRDGADVLIIDRPINVSVDKEWTGGPVSVPPADTPARFYPSTTVTIQGTNESLARVDQLRLVEPGLEGSGEVQVEDGTTPFDAFTLRAITVTPPEGTETTTVTLTSDDGSTAELTEAEAEALTPGDLADVVGVEVAFDGRVAADATGSMDLTLQLRELDRYTGEPVTVADHSPVPDTAAAQVTDPGGTDDDSPLAWDDAEMVLQQPGIGVEVAKSFDPAQVVEPGTGPVRMTLSGTPEGPSRTVEMVLTDDEPRFWNQYDFVGFADPTLAEPIQQVRVDAFTGGTFTEGGDGAGVTVTGGDWVTGTPSATFVLPDGVAPEDVQGLRFTFTRTDGSIWENPAGPTQDVPMDVERREELRTGGPVLPDLAANPPAPGESEPGVATNEVDGTTTGADLVVDPDTGELVPVSAADSAEAQVTYVHAENGVEIVKDFAGTVSDGTEAPNAVFPMNITITNTGNRPIVDPVVTDPMPTDAGGAQLRLADVDEPYSYTLTGAAPDPANGPALPTDPAEVSVDRTGDIENLQFTFPEGSVLEVGQTYTITVQVQFRVDLPAETVVENTAGVTGDRPWDECVTRLDEETGACEADADVTSVPAGVLAQSKVVRATNDDELDVIVDPAADPDTECLPDEGGYYAYPCTPVIAPGHDETWQVRIDNRGNLPITKVVSYDRLPVPGDTGSYADSERGSQWQPILTNDPPPELVHAPPGAEATFYYTTATDYCMDDIDEPRAEPVCPTGDPESGWVELTGAEGEDLYETITALKAVVTLTEENPLQPGEFIAFEGTTTTPAVAPEAGNESIAYNSAAASGVVQAPEGPRDMLPTEGTKVGVATATGTLEVVKQVTGEGADHAPDTFDMEVECTSAIGSWVETQLEPVPITVSPDEPATVTNLPYGAECTVTEDPDGGQTELVVGSVTIGQEPEVTTLTAVNRYDLASLELAKEVVTDAVGQDGEPVPYGPFEVTVDCTFLGDPVYATGYGPRRPMVVTLEDGDVTVLEGLPVAAECTATETGTGGAASVEVTVTHDGEEPVVTEGPEATTEVTPDASGESTTEVAFTNQFDVGAIELAKVVDGEGAEMYGAGPFTLGVLCALDDDGEGAGEPRVVYDGTVTLGAAGPLTAQVPNLPTGAVCTVTEPDDAGATSTTISPEQVTVGSGDVVEVTVTNTFDVGAVTVDKMLAGEGAELYGAGPFEVTLACTFDGEPVSVPGGAARALVPGEPVVYDGLPVGAECVATETATGGATSTTVSAVGDGGMGDGGVGDGGAGDGGDGGSAAVVVPAGDPAAIAVTNTFEVGEVRVVKTLSGPDAAEHEGDVFTVELACTQDVDGVERAIEIPGGPERTLSAADDWVAVYADLPQGATCQATETDAGSADSVTIVVDGTTTETDPADGDPRSAEFDLPVGDDVCRPVHVTNTWFAATDAATDAANSGLSGLAGVGRTAGADRSALPDECRDMGDGTDPDPAPEPDPDDVPGDVPGADGPGTDPGPGTLPRTGADALTTALIALLLLITGGTVVTVSRRMRGGSRAR